MRSRPNPRWSRPLAILTAVLFLTSLVFPVGAGLSKDAASSLPSWWGPLDVTLAFVLAALAVTILALGHGRVTREIETATYRAYRVLIHGILVLLVVFLAFGDRIVWSNGLSGIAWRSWLLFYCLPEWIAMFRIPIG